MTTEADLLAVFATARAHLRPGGLLIAAPDDHTDTFDPPRVDYQTNRDAETELTYVEYSTDLDPTDTTYVFFMKRGGELRVEADSHTTGLFPVATWARPLTEAGFEVDRVEYPVSKDGWGMWLWVGRVVGGVAVSFAGRDWDMDPGFRMPRHYMETCYQSSTQFKIPAAK